MTKILATLGPISSNKNIKYLVNKSDMVRLNMSHNSVDWHNKMINKIKIIDHKKTILVDVPGVKPRTLNNNEIRIKKGQKIIFAYNSTNKNIIPISNPLPKISKKTKIKTFSISDGAYIFNFVSLKNKLLTGISLQDFTLLPRKGLNIPFSIYNDNLQSKLYTKFIKKIRNLRYDCIGLSFVQSSKIIKKLKIQNKSKVFISKIENYLGYLNRKEIIKESDAIMIDRGDLAAEVGNEKITDFTNNIIEECKNLSKPVIIATENLNSLINSLSPSKSDILNLDYFLSKKVDYIMLSDETATSKYWKNTLYWLNNFFKLRNKKIYIKKKLDIYEIIKNTQDQVLVLFSKKGFFLKNISGVNYAKLFLFTQDKMLAKTSSIKENITSFFTMFPKKNLDNFLFKNLKKNKKLIFKNNDFALLINVSFPRKKSRANNIIVISKKDF